MPKRYVIKLSESEQAQLEQLVRRGQPAYLRERAAAILQVVTQVPLSHIATQGLLRPRRRETISTWVQRYQQAGIAGLRIRPGRGRKPAYAAPCVTPEVAQARIEAVIQQPPCLFGHSQSRWNLQRLLSSLPWLPVTTLPGLWQLLARLKIQYKRGRQYVHSPDAHYALKQAWIQECLAKATADPTRYTFLYLDELTFYRQPTVASGYARQGSRNPLARRSYQSNTSARILGAVNALTGQVTYTLRSKITLPVLRQFYYTLRQTYADTHTLYVAQDNWPVHFHPDITVVLAPQTFPWPPQLPKTWRDLSPRTTIPPDSLPIQLLFQPTYAPWTNPIEKLWRWLYQEHLHLHHRSNDWLALKQQVKDFLDQFATGSLELLRYIGLSPPESVIV